MAAMRDLPRLMESGSLEERKEFIRAFIAGVTVVPEKLRLDLQIRELPAVLPGDSTCEMVAGARYKPPGLAMPDEGRGQEVGTAGGSTSHGGVESTASPVPDHDGPFS